MRRPEPRLSYTAALIGVLLVSSSATSRAQQIDAAETVAIEEGSVVSLEYTLTLDDGSVADSNVGHEPLVYTQGEGELLTALEAALAGLSAGDTREVRLEPEEGYGAVKPELFEAVDPAQIPEDGREVGRLLMRRDPAGRPVRVRVREVREDAIVLDRNHPFAGEALNFSVRIISVE